VALWCFYHTQSLEEGLLAVLNMGGDAETIGAIYGQLAGVFYGVGDIL
jgi:ADP-ribosyl-[dinitrogen reductase] hydrolase